KLWDVASGKELHTLRGHTGRVSSVAFAPDGASLVSGGWDGSVKLWDAETGHQLDTLAGQGRGFWVVAFSPDGKTLAVGNEDGTVTPAPHGKGEGPPANPAPPLPRLYRIGGSLMVTLLGTPRRCCDGVTRRETLKAGALSLLGSGFTLPNLLRAEQGKPK